MHPMSIRPFAATCAIALAASLCGVSPAGATTLTFEGLPDAPGADGFSTLADANGGSATLAGITFDAAANAEWDIVGNAFVAYQDTFAASHSGTYALTGNAFVGSVTDAFGNAYDFTGLTIGTAQRLTQLWVAFDDNGLGSNDAQSLTITALTASGDVSTSVALTGTTLSLFDTSATFGGLAGITGYRFTTVASNDLYAAAGQAYVVADDLTFAPAAAAVPEPPVVVLLGVGLAALAFASARRRLLAAFASRRPTPSRALARDARRRQFIVNPS